MGSIAITFVTPHQRPNSGGVYTIEQFARHWAEQGRAALLVEKGEIRPVPGVEVLAINELGPSGPPDADAILVPADAKRRWAFELPIEKGRPLLLFQGYGEPGNPAVVDNMRRVGGAVCGAEWLVREAEEAGCSARLIRYGMDRELFSPGEPAADRDTSVAMMTHSSQWKGTEDGLRALELARASLPFTISLFGKFDPGLAGAEFIAAPPAGRREIGELLRRAAVFVCPSWEEGFGLPGIEALECGAALATTDTKGSRDYARDGETALVSPPRDPETLAQNIVRLLEDQWLRRRLAETGSQMVRRTYPDWAESARQLGVAVAELLD